MGILKLSIIIPTYNDIYLLDKTIECILNSDMTKEEYEILVCDDGSYVNNFSLIKKYEKNVTLDIFISLIKDLELVKHVIWGF